MGRLMSGLNPLEISGRRVGPAFVGQPVPRPFPFEGQPMHAPFPFKTLGSVWPARGVGLGPKVPTLPICSCTPPKRVHNFLQFICQRFGEQERTHTIRGDGLPHYLNQNLLPCLRQNFTLPSLQPLTQPLP